LYSSIPLFYDRMKERVAGQEVNIIVRLINMEFHVPQFIEMETKIVGPLTWRQFLYVGGAAFIAFFLYFILRKYLFWFIFTSIILVGGGLALAFIPIAGQSLPSFLKNFFTYSVASKIYLWKKKKMPPQIIYERKVGISEKELVDASRLKIGGGGKLRDLSIKIETRTK